MAFNPPLFSKLNPPLISDLSNRPSVTEKASKTFMFGGKDSLDMTFLLPSKSSFLSLLRVCPLSALTSHCVAGDVILAGANTILKVDVDNHSSRKVGCISAALRV
jgi:hypothetical protein